MTNIASDVWLHRLAMVFFVVASAWVGYVLVSTQSTFALLYLLFPIALYLGYFQANLKIWASVTALAVIVIGGLVEPYALDTVEESFILIPLIYLALFPGTFWPVLICLIILSLYLPALDPKDFSEFVEDAIEILVITGFACVMTFFQQLSSKTAQSFKHDSETDHLTKLSNRRAFYRRLHSLPTIERNTLLHIDIDKFKSINNNLSHSAGDEILRQLAKRLQSKLTSTMSIYRIGSDEFCILALKTERDQIEALCQILTAESALNFTLDGRRYQISISIGIADYQQCIQNIDGWVQSAELALEKCKGISNQSYLWFDEAMQERQARRFNIEKGLDNAIERNEFSLMYQPKVDIKTDLVHGAEALIRWHNRKLGWVSPAEFIPVSEDTQHILAIGRWVINSACAQGREWLDKGYQCPISVNVSTVQLAYDDMYQVVEDALINNNFPGKLLQIEITETAIMSQSERTVATCHKLRNLGVQIVLDDFGIAYSCLSYLRRLPVDLLKIDKSFVDECVDEPKAHMLIRTIVQMGHNLNMKVTAEGVESELQLSLLKSERCDRYQGYLFSKPVPPEKLERLLAKSQPIAQSATQPKALKVQSR
ncbi:GGDEF domain-containing phosphodiesterase [Vibrio sp. SCSIO 43136]|uniref:putative bifunctional diguanylate cyclase/phosphodiesterase n=1 Tax=Vibrio sp. SCSIO 43136 TaxID=2819101 RepID=UPI0020755FC1|nr:GGDEF domain-containing phosphodiesterase [Vibrio sp. SCSIO 43136]USD64831.1 EAL domain-containing protein [Vibrio sp. SCSIO 43136]